MLDPREERTSVVRSKLLNIMAERMRGGPTPRTNQNGNGVPQQPPVGTGLSGHNQRPSLGSNNSVPQLGVLSFEQARQQQQQRQPQQQPQQPQQPQQQRDDNWAQPPPHPSEWRALTPIAERSTRDSGSLDAGSNPPPLQGPGLCIVNGSPHSSQIQPQLSEASQDLPKLQTDTEPPTTTILGEPLVTSPASHTPLPGFGIGRTNSAGSLGSKPDSHRSQRELASLSRPDSRLDTHASTDAIRPAGGSTSPPLNSPGKESVFSALPSPYSNQPIHPTQSTFSDIPKTPPRSSDRPTFTPPNQKGPGMEHGSGSPTPSSPSRFQGAIQGRNTGSPSNPPTSAKKAKTPEPTPPPQTDPHLNSPIFSPTPTTVNSPPTLSHTTTTTSTTSKSEYSGYSGGAGPSPPQQMPGVISPNFSNQGPHPTPQSQRTVQGEPSQTESLSASLSGKLEGAKPVTRVDEGRKERSGDDHDLGKEAGALYYMREIQDASAVPPPRIVGRGQNIPVNLKGRSDTDDDGEDEEPSTEDEPRPLPQPTRTQPQPQLRMLPEPSPLQVRRPSAQAKAPFVAPPPPPPLPASPPQYPTQPPNHTTQSQYQAHGYTQGRAQQPVLAPQPQQPVMSSFNRISAIENDVTSPDLSSPGSDGNQSSAFSSRRTSVIGGGGSRPGLVSRPSGARDLVMKQRGGEITSHSRRNGQPRHPLPPHPESSSEQSSQFPSYPTYTQSSHHQGQIFAQTPGDTTQQPLPAIGTADRYPVNMANVDQRQHYDDNSDALAALTFLERDEANAVRRPPPPPQETRHPTSDTEPDPYDAPPVYVTPSDGGGDVLQENGSFGAKYKSSFAPSKQATQRLAKSQAQQAAHQAAVHRPGKAGGTNGKGKRRVRQDGWAESSDEEEEDEDDDDEDVDSDGDPVAPARGRSPGTGVGQNLGKLSAQGSPYGSTTDLNQVEQGRTHRYLPRPPSLGRGYGMCLLRGALISSYPFDPDLISCRRSRRLLPSARVWRFWTICSPSAIWAVPRHHPNPAS